MIQVDFRRSLTMEILSNIAILCSEQEMVDKLVALNDAEEIIEIIKRGA